MSKTTETALEKVRVYILAKELKLETKDLLVICQELGFSGIKNQLSGLEPDQVTALRKRVKDGPARTAAPARPTPAPTIGGPPKSLDTRVRTLPPAKPKAPSPLPPPPAPVAVEPEPVAPPPPVQPEPVIAQPEPVVAKPEPVVEVAKPAPAGIPAPEPQIEPAPAAVAPPKAVDPVPPTITPPPAVMPPTGVPLTRGMPNLTNRPPTIRAAGGRPATHGPTQPRPPVASPPPTAAEQPPAPEAKPAPVLPPPPAPAVSPPAPATNPNPPRVAPPPSTGPTRVAPPPPTGPTRVAPPPSSGPMRTLPPTNNPQPTRSGPPGSPRASGPPAGAPQQPLYGPRGATGAGGPQRQAPPPAGPKAPPPAAGASKSLKLTPEQIKKMRELEKARGGRMDLTQIQKQVTQEPVKTGETAPAADKPADRRSPPSRFGTASPAGRQTAAEEEEAKKKAAGGVVGREGRHAARQSRDRRGTGPTDKGSVIISGGQAEVLDQKFGSRRGPRAALMAKMKRRGAQVAVKKEGPVEITLPITVRTLSEAIGVKLGELSKQLLKETQQLYGAASQIEFEVAELIAINKGITLVQKKVKSPKELLLEEFEKQANEVDPEKLRPRPPIVVIMGHVDHGKTTLLDRIREQYGLASDVVSTEAGGITQVLRAWRVEKDGKPVTFLDTPGHEAFTKMRARGANVTDIAVIVVAATDGVMPQTEEAIAHARAADVAIIVAINKVDMPNANLDKTRRQLYSLNLLPDNMGGDIQFVETSAVTGQGIGELLDAIGLVAELSDPPLTADPEHKPSGTCLEAYMDGDRGVMATLLVQQGTLRKGDVILCGATSGRVRAMFDDLGRPVDEAGPSTPVKIFGLDEVPDADDPFYFVEELTKAVEIAEKERELIRERNLFSMGPKSLEQLKEANARQKITELKVILKAEARGSVEAIKKELEKLIHEEVRCRVLSAGIGAISESDVTLALTSPADTLVIGFNVTADDEALKLAEARGISLREYQIIYNLVDDVKAALEGRLKPIEEVVHLGRAVVRDTFKVSKVGTIAGCYVTSGVIERSAKVRVIRAGAIVFPPAERVAALDSLKRFKDDAKEVREGFECGLKITGFDDVKVDDVIEAYRIEIKQRTL